MTDYKDLIKSLRICTDAHECIGCVKNDGTPYGCKSIRIPGGSGDIELIREAADALEDLLKAAKKMHLWIFLNTGDEQKVYDECGLSDEMNAALGYGGRLELRAEPTKEEG